MWNLRPEIGIKVFGWHLSIGWKEKKWNLKKNFFSLSLSGKWNCWQNSCQDVGKFEMSGFFFFASEVFVWFSITFRFVSTFPCVLGIEINWIKFSFLRLKMSTSGKPSYYILIKVKLFLNNRYSSAFKPGFILFEISVILQNLK